MFVSPYLVRHSTNVCFFTGWRVHEKGRISTNTANLLYLSCLYHIIQLGGSSKYMNAVCFSIHISAWSKCECIPLHLLTEPFSDRIINLWQPCSTWESSVWHSIFYLVHLLLLSWQKYVVKAPYKGVNILTRKLSHLQSFVTEIDRTFLYPLGVRISWESTVYCVCYAWKCVLILK